VSEWRQSYLQRHGSVGHNHTVVRCDGDAREVHEHHQRRVRSFHVIVQQLPPRHLAVLNRRPGRSLPDVIQLPIPGVCVRMRLKSSKVSGKMEMTFAIGGRPRITRGRSCCWQQLSVPFDRDHWTHGRTHAWAHCLQLSDWNPRTVTPWFSRQCCCVARDKNAIVSRCTGLEPPGSGPRTPRRLVGARRRWHFERRAEDFLVGDVERDQPTKN
jgi:hypothetical protein